MQIKRRRKHKYAVHISGFFFALALLGIVTIVYGSIMLTRTVLDNSKEKQMFEGVIRPVVMFNPPPFEKATDIEMPSLLLYCMWSTLMEKRDAYQYGENGEIIVPASDLDVVAAKLFGPDVKLIHQSFGEMETTYYYDEKASVYNVPVLGLINVYTPSVEEITKNGEYLQLLVGYIPSGVSWRTDFNGGKGQPAPEKKMFYIMQKNKDGYSIVKVQDVPNTTNIQPPANGQ